MKYLVYIILFFLFILVLMVNGQNSPVLDDYIKYGIDNNLALKQKNESYEKSLYALKEAKGLFYPSVSLNARYTVAQGGRIIDFPVGDMLNPVYSTLNALTGTNDFPQLENMEFPFYRPKEQETKITAIQPLYNPQIGLNKKIKSELVTSEKADAQTYQRKLIEEIKVAYFNYLKIIKLSELLDETADLLKENIRVNEKLFENGMVTRESIFRARSELSKLEQQQAGINKNANLSRAYFNFLLNKPLESDIALLDTALETPAVITLEMAQNSALENREEVKKIETYQKISLLNVKLNQSENTPSIFAVADYGIQGDEYSFTKDDDYLLASVVLKWTLFKGYSNHAKVQQARIDKQIIDNKSLEVNQQIKLDVINAYYELEAALKAIDAANDHLKTAKESFRLVDKKYNQGQAGMLEYIDARTEMTNAGMNVIITRYDYFIKYAGYEKSACLYKME